MLLVGGYGLAAFFVLGVHIAAFAYYRERMDEKRKSGQRSAPSMWPLVWLATRATGAGQPITLPHSSSV